MGHRFLSWLDPVRCSLRKLGIYRRYHWRCWGRAFVLWFACLVCCLVGKRHLPENPYAVFTVTTGVIYSVVVVSGLAFILGAFSLFVRAVYRQAEAFQDGSLQAEIRGQRATEDSERLNGNLPAAVVSVRPRPRL